MNGGCFDQLFQITPHIHVKSYLISLSMVTSIIIDHLCVEDEIP